MRARGFGYDARMRVHSLLVSTAFAFSCAILALQSSAAEACSLAALPMHEVDPDAIDDVAPAAPEVDEIAIIRGHGCEGSDTCADLGFVSLRLVPGNDDQSPPEAIGYRIEAIAGDVPDGLLPGYDARAQSDELFLVWIDGADNIQESLAVTLRITAIDEAGNLSAPIEVELLDEGGEGDCATDPTDPTDPMDPDTSGCSIAIDSRGRGLGVGFLLFGLALLTRRRHH